MLISITTPLRSPNPIYEMLSRQSLNSFRYFPFIEMLLTMRSTTTTSLTDMDHIPIISNNPTSSKASAK